MWREEFERFQAAQAVFHAAKVRMGSRKLQQRKDRSLENQIELLDHLRVTITCLCDRQPFLVQLQKSLPILDHVLRRASESNRVEAPLPDDLAVPFEIEMHPKCDQSTGLS